LWHLFLALPILWLPALAPAAEATPRIGANSIQTGQTLDLVHEAGGQLSSGPEVPLLSRDFDIVNRSTERSGTS